MQRTVRIWLFSVLALVAAAVYLGPTLLNVVPKSGAHGSGEALIGGPFTLINAKGEQVTDEAFRGKFMLVYFGFTHCPDICPTTLLMMAQALKTLGKEAAEITPIFITLDPKRDTPQVMGTYVKNFYPDLVGLSGSKEQIAAVADRYKVYYSLVKNDSAMGYMVDHSGFVYLMDPQGKYLTHFSHTMPLQAMVSGLRKYVY